MPLVTLVPKYPLVEEKVANLMSEIRSEIKTRVAKTPDFSQSEVLVYLAKCPYRDADPDAADLVLLLQTCPHEVLEALSNELCRDLAMILARFGLSVGSGAEVWLTFLPGPWCHVQDGEIVDSVPHPRI